MTENIDKQAQNIVKLLRSVKMKISSAESCTGGLVSAAITSVSGSSEVFDFGICSYSNQIKHKILGVPEEHLKNFGAVSEQVAKAMAEGAMRISDSDFSVSTTGIAGPGGGTSDKPVGTVWIGICNRQNGATAHCFKFDASDCPEKLTKREYIRKQSVLKALELLEKEILNAL